MKNHNLQILISFFLLSYLVVNFAMGYSASSSNYILQSDSVNFGGGYSTSSSYGLQDTMGEIGTGIATSSSYVMSSGYQAMFSNTYIAITSPEDIVLSPTISGVGGGVSNGSSSWAVQTDNPSGYELSVRSAGSPALSAGANHFLDYVPSYAEPDYVWNTPATEMRFGYTPEGNDLVTLFKDDGISCGSGSLDTEARCWMGFSTNNRVVSRAQTANIPNWSTTTIRMKAEIGSSKLGQQGTYQASIIVTAITL